MSLRETDEPVLALMDCRERASHNKSTSCRYCTERDSSHASRYIILSLLCLILVVDKSPYRSSKHADSGLIDCLSQRPIESPTVFRKAVKIITDCINAAGNAIAPVRPSVCPSVCLFPLYLTNRLTASE